MSSLASAVTGADLALARPFGDHMVLPMRRDVPVWGTAHAGAAVEIQFRGKAVTTTADKSGSWRAILPAMEPSAKAASLTVRSADQSLVIKNLLTGRVFLCSGQSNMDFQLGRAVGGADEAKRAGKFPAIRLCNLTGAPTDSRVYDAATLARLNERDHFTGGWEVATEKSAAAFSAIAWWMGKMIHELDGVPVGLVENAIGGSGTEAWLPRNVLSARKNYAPLLDNAWLSSPQISPWARGRAKQNLGKHPDANHPFKPGFLFESGVRPWCGFPFDAVLWYQGETNAEIADDAWNRQLITYLVAGWRKELRQGKLPFYLIQLPRIGGNEPIRQHWPEYRKVQADVARKLPGVHLVVTQDLGWDSPDVHPPDKLPVARRLAEAMAKSLEN
ncbi:sialate O-acetylesterase [Luteolibacter arcticus]|uniref:Sialate O-acetylesterase n=1 Tax=Luteolibacter arcticus TaxID=1581411 RepID=A0ABT3GQL1_9BACT|nr:sialate O-acetylesterase [Luteolibacter arcticus]MCW1925777.1 sialate O-acetylesterase [Luteolibacter arcticus]